MNRFFLYISLILRGELTPESDKLEANKDLCTRLQGMNSNDLFVRAQREAAPLAVELSTWGLISLYDSLLLRQGFSEDKVHHERVAARVVLDSDFT